MNTKKKIAIVLFLLIACIATMSFATDIVTNEIGEDVVVEESIEETLVEPRTVTIPRDQQPEGVEENVEAEVERKSIYDNFYKGSADAKYTLSDNIYGNVFVAGNEVIIDSDYISGDVFIAGNNITINENTVIDGNIYLAAQSVNVKGTIYKSTYIAGKVITLSETSTLEYDTFVVGDIVELKGTISRSIYAYVGKLVVGNTANLERNLTYEANEKAEIPEGVVKGNVDFRQIVVEEKTTAEIVFEYIVDLLQSLIFTLSVFLVISLMSNKFVYKSQESIGKHLLKSVGIGLFGLIIIPILMVLLIVLNSTAVVGLALIPAYILMLMIANSITAIAIAGMLCARSKGMKLPIVVALIAIALWALETLPYVGTLATFFSMLIGLGVLLQNIFNGKKAISKSADDVK